MTAEQPSEPFDATQLSRGLRFLIIDGIASQVMTALTGGAFLIAFVLLLDAPHAVIGLIAAIGPLSQVLQLPAVLLVETVRKRKLLAVGAFVAGRLFWLVAAAIPWLAPADLRLPLLIGVLVAFHALTSISSCAYNSWKRDLIPEHQMGRYLGQRMAVGTSVAAALTLVAGLGLDYWERSSQAPEVAYCLLFLVAGLVGLVGTAFLSRVPEPAMDEERTEPFRRLFAEPFRDRNFRSLLIFLACWNLAVNLASPFFTVYMLQNLDLRIGLVTVLAVTSQVVNILFLRIWGRLADRYSNKSVLAVSGPMFIISIIAWPFTTLPERWFLTLPLLFAIHILAGASTAGVMIGAANITLKAAPRGRATAFIATNSLVSGIAASIAPILAGLSADFFGDHRLSLSLNWTSTTGVSEPITFPALDLQGLDFVFVLSFLFGLYALHRLLAVQEEGEVEERVVLDELYSELKRTIRNVSSIAGLRQLTYFPYSWLRPRRRPAPTHGDGDGDQRT